VIVSCSCYAPTPSMAACLVNRFRMRRDVLTYHLAGMGCSSSLVCVDLAKRLLQARARPAAGFPPGLSHQPGPRSPPPPS